MITYDDVIGLYWYLFSTRITHLHLKRHEVGGQVPRYEVCPGVTMYPGSILPGTPEVSLLEITLGAQSESSGPRAGCFDDAGIG